MTHWLTLRVGGATALLVGLVSGCGELGQEKADGTLPRQEVKKEEVASDTDAADSGSPDIFDEKTGVALLPVGAVIPKVPAVACVKKRSNRELVTRVFQDVVNRSPTAEELRDVEAASFDYEKWIEDFVTSPKMEDGYTKFVTALLRLDAIKPVNMNDATEAQLVNDLKQEPIELVKRNKDKPWPWFWRTQTFYCNERTASLYGLTRLNAPSFVECKLPPERAGFLGLVSVLRASSQVGAPQAFYLDSNNYGRVKNYLYWVKGMKLAANTAGPKGNAKIIHMASCVPTTDMRVKMVNGEPGLIYGTASVPLAGSSCSGCHSKYNGPLSIAFRRFNETGMLLDLPAIDRLNNEQRNGSSNDLLKRLLVEQSSCWSPDPEAPPQPFVGLVGLSDITSRSPTFGPALGIQIPDLLSNSSPDTNSSASIAKAYYENGQTLKAAFKGYFLSESYRCETKK